MLYADKSREMDRGGNDIVGRLSEVHVVIGMNLAGAASTTEQFARTVGNDLVGVHVGRGARTGLENIEHEMIIQLAIDDFLSRSHNRLGNLWVNRSQRFVCLCCRLLDLSKRTNKLAREAQIADREVEHGTLCACTVIGIYGDVHLAHRVAFDAGLFCISHSESSVLSMCTEIL